MYTYQRPKKFVALKFIARLLVSMIISFPPIHLYVLLSSKEISNVYALFVVSSLVPWFLIFFILYSICDRINTKFGLWAATEPNCVH